MKLKNKLFIALGAVSLFATLGVSTALITSCSQSANPYWPDTQITATINGTLSTYSFYNQQKDGFKTGIPNSQNQESLAKLSSDITDFKNSSGQPIWDATTTNASQITSSSNYGAYKELITKFNYANITSQIFSYLYSMYSNLTKVLSQVPLMIANPTNNSFSDISQYYANCATTPKSKEFIIGFLQGIGLGWNRYSIGIKEINLDISITENNTQTTFKDPASVQFNHNDPNSYAYSIKVNKFDLTFSWYREDHYGGVWISNGQTGIDQVNSALADADIQVLQKNGCGNKISSNSYTTSFIPTNSPVIFNALPAYRPIGNTDYFSGVYTLTSPLINNPNYKPTDNPNTKWKADDNTLPFQMFGITNYKQMYSIFNDFTIANLTNHDVINNNYNYLFWGTYVFLWKLGYFKNHPSELPDSQTFKDALTTLTNKYKFNGNLSPKWNELKTIPEYTSAITSIYSYLKNVN